jgi:hypothetical protein
MFYRDRPRSHSRKVKQAVRDGRSVSAVLIILMTAGGVASLFLNKRLPQEPDRPNSKQRPKHAAS